ncbi:MAG: NDP-sugar synthase [Methanomassiliicoccales archaeon]
MDAVILAGGFGTRLRPLTNHIPKPLVRIAGKTIIDRLIATIPDGAERILIAAGYRGDDLTEHFRKLGAGNVEIVVEREPLGTAGALYNMRNKLGDRFFVLNGDVMCSLSLKDMLAYHTSKGAAMTISLWPVEDVSAYGAVAISTDGSVTEFREKPKGDVRKAGYINAGAYIMEKSVFDKMDMVTFSLEKEVFPHLCGRGLYGFSFTGYWFDCGSLPSYIAAQETLMKVENAPIQKGAKLNGCVINRPVSVEDGASIFGSQLGPNVYIERGAKVMEGCRLSNCVIMEDAVLGEGCTINNSIVSPGLHLPDGTEGENKILDESNY